MKEKYYDVCCTPVNDEEIDSLVKKLYKNKDRDEFDNIEMQVYHLLIHYYLEKGYQTVFHKCVSILRLNTWENDVFVEKLLGVRSCQNFMFDIDMKNLKKINNMIIRGIKSDDSVELTEYICCTDDSHMRHWVYYMYVNKYPRDEIIGLLKKALKFS